MRITHTFTVASTPETVFDYITDPANLPDWQTSKTRVQALTDGPPRQGFQLREWTKPPGVKQFEQIVELAEFDRPRRLRVHVIEGPYPVDGTWSLTPVTDGTRVEFVAEGELRGAAQLAGPIFKRLMRRQFATYHHNLRANVESLRSQPDAETVMSSASCRGRRWTDTPRRRARSVRVPEAKRHERIVRECRREAPTYQKRPASFAALATITI